MQTHVTLEMDGDIATLTFAWTPEQPGTYTASFMLIASGQEYGPISEDVDVSHVVYLPMIMKN